jgi:hypothetical protein
LNGFVFPVALTHVLVLVLFEINKSTLANIAMSAVISFARCSMTGKTQWVFGIQNNVALCALGFCL